ncbi:MULTISPECIES: hypothetical protein [Ochrobactrum]|uniref:Uncharacterized protein n=1 Tax=Ochrobactrum teleogrylli TaxID=2479765 RepID=A0ABY2YAI1_9HYPH|nr:MULTISPECIES: hypothetical protein [Brucella]MCI1000582.1 hypothetical protein [Ochrobactrum sp. C6C9]TNV18528.1 hypothetical protein FIC94_02665 [[Ochrobactrum] teleogrylli]
MIHPFLSDLMNGNATHPIGDMEHVPALSTHASGLISLIAIKFPLLASRKIKSPAVPGFFDLY